MAAAAMTPCCVETAFNPASFPGVSFTVSLLCVCKAAILNRNRPAHVEATRRLLLSIRRHRKYTRRAGLHASAKPATFHLLYFLRGQFGWRNATAWPELPGGSGVHIGQVGVGRCWAR